MSAVALGQASGPTRTRPANEDAKFQFDMEVTLHPCDEYITSHVFDNVI